MAEKPNSNYLDTLSNAFNAVKAWRFATFSLAAVLLVLVYALIYQARNTPVLVIPHDFASANGRMQVAVNGEIRGTSAEYMANLALSDLSLILNFTPDNVITQHQRFLNRVTEDLYGTQREALLAQADEYKRRAMTQSFFPEDVKVSQKSDKVEVSGTQIRWMGGKEVLRNRVTYVVTYKIYKGFAHVADLRQKSKVEE